MQVQISDSCDTCPINQINVACVKRFTVMCLHVGSHICQLKRSNAADVRSALYTSCLC